MITLVVVFHGMECGPERGPERGLERGLERNVLGRVMRTAIQPVLDKSERISSRPAEADSNWDRQRSGR